MAETLRRRRSILAGVVCVMLAIGVVWHPMFWGISQVEDEERAQPGVAMRTLERLPVKGRAPKTGYERAQFGEGWRITEGCDMRNRILARDMDSVEWLDDECVVSRGELHDPYTDSTIQFQRGPDTSTLVQIDHVVALSDAWQKGAQQLPYSERVEFANDPLNLLAVDGQANQEKSDSDAASWLPPNKQFRCQYVARQIAVKAKYSLWITRAEYEVMARILDSCPGQSLPGYDTDLRADIK